MVFNKKFMGLKFVRRVDLCWYISIFVPIFLHKIHFCVIVTNLLSNFEDSLLKSTLYRFTDATINTNKAI